MTQAPPDQGGARVALLRACEQVRVLSGPVPSPCSSICRMETQTGCCAGCLRTLDEIAAWSKLSEAGRREVWQRIETRLRAGQLAI